MKKALLFLLVLSVSFTYAQESENKDNRFDFGLALSFGSADLRNSEFGVVNGNLQAFNMNASYLLFQDSFLDDIRLQLGLTFAEFNSTLQLNNLNASLSNSYVQVPLNVIFSTNRDSPIRFNIGGGVNANYFLKSEIHELSGSSSQNINKVTFGYQAITGFDYFLKENFFIGIHFATQGDYSSVRKDGISNRLVRARFLQLSLGATF